MHRIKIYVTILLLYEFVILTILQIPDYCFGVFNVNFCSVGFRYFLMAIVVPVLFGLFAWWVPEIRRVFCSQCKYENQKDKSIKDIFKEIISKQDIERLITAAIIMGIQKFAANHPKTKETFATVVNALEKEGMSKKVV